MNSKVCSPFNLYNRTPLNAFLGSDFLKKYISAKCLINTFSVNFRQTDTHKKTNDVYRWNDRRTLAALNIGKLGKITWKTWKLFSKNCVTYAPLLGKLAYLSLPGVVLMLFLFLFSCPMKLVECCRQIIELGRLSLNFTVNPLTTWGWGASSPNEMAEAHVKIILKVAGHIPSYIQMSVSRFLFYI